jgi:hypothetical protein
MPKLRSAARELASVRTEVQKRIDTEFRSDNISVLIAKAAKERTEKELTGIIRSEASVQVEKGIKEQGPAIQKVVEIRLNRLLLFSPRTDHLISPRRISF